MSKHEPVTRGTILYWIAMAILWIGIVIVAWIVFHPPQDLGI
ncbi:MAG TPA: hypothetical protein VFK09_09515 [Gemmatimonadales bacterium]|nr:hypothetical protein [Gemmatimonadales bacterium]